jgi:hypothetical protein
VIVPPGVVHVELDYRPRGWQPALAISIAALAMVGFFAWPRRVRDLRGN